MRGKSLMKKLLAVVMVFSVFAQLVSVSNIQAETTKTFFGTGSEATVTTRGADASVTYNYSNILGDEEFTALKVIYTWDPNVMTFKSFNNVTTGGDGNFKYIEAQSNVANGKLVASYDYTIGSNRTSTPSITLNFTNCFADTDIVNGTVATVHSEYDPEYDDWDDVTWLNVSFGNVIQQVKQGEEDITDATITLSLPTSIAMDAGNPTSITKGESDTFSATVTNDSNPAKGVEWSVSGNSNVGTTMNVSTGELTIADDETATSLTVKATSNADTSKSATTTVAVANKPSLSMSMTQDKTKVLKGGSTVQFSATPNPTEATGETTTVTYAVAGASGTTSINVATGELTIGADEPAGTLTVTATATNGKTNPTTQTATGTVEIVEVGVSIPVVSVSLSRGENYTFDATLTNDLDSDGVTWSLNDTTYSSIDASTGQVTIGAGETAASLTVTATSNADASKTASSTVYVKEVSIVIDDTDDIVVQGETRTLTVTTENDETANKNKATWSLTGAQEVGTAIDPDTGVLTINENEPAETTLRVKAVSKTDTSAYTERDITVEAVEIDNDTREIDMLVKNSFTLTSSVAGGTWEFDDEYFTQGILVSNPSTASSTLLSRIMATVNGDSITLTAIKAGTSEITYTVYGVETTYTVTVDTVELEVDLADGNITISENADGDLVITNTDDGTETVVSKDRELNIVDSAETGNTVTVDTTDVDFGNVEGNISITENGSATITGDVTGDITTDGTVVVEGNIDGNLIVTETGTTEVTGSVTGNVTSEGSITVDGNIEGDVKVEENGSANITGDIKGEVTSNGELAVEGTITGDVIVNEGGSANVTGSVNGNIVSDGEVAVNGNITGNITITENGSADITGNVTGNINNDGGSLAVEGSVTGDVSSSNGASTSVTGDVDGDVTTDGSSTNTNIGGEVTGEVNDINGGTTTIETPEEPEKELVMDGVPTENILVGKEFTLTPSIAGGTWSYDEEYLEATKVESLSRLAVVGDAITFKALKKGETVVNYTVNGNTYAYVVKIVEDSASIAPTPAPTPGPDGNLSPGPGGSTGDSTQGGTTPGTDSSPSKAVDTADSTNTMPYAIMVVFSMLGIVAIGMNKRRKYLQK